MRGTASLTLVILGKAGQVLRMEGKMLWRTEGRGAEGRLWPSQLLEGWSQGGVPGRREQHEQRCRGRMVAECREI